MILSALASFNKNIRSSTLHRLILTWIGVIAQGRSTTVHQSCIQQLTYFIKYSDSITF
jgi:hypothetical protein